MNLPPVPQWNAAAPYHLQMQAYGLVCIEAYKVSVSKRCSKNRRKFSDKDADYIRQLHANGWTYKQVYKHNKMSEITFINIIKRRGAYK